MKSTTTNERIREKARELFSIHGPRNVSMDDIAKATGISKKTIYQQFGSKNALVNAIVDELVRAHEQLFEVAQSTAKDAVDEVLKQDAGLSLVCKGLRPSFLYELENFFPDGWKTLEQYKIKIYNNIADNLDRGKKEGVYREDIDSKFISDLRMHQLANVLKPELFAGANVSIKQLSDQFTVLYLHAIATEKGKRLLNMYLFDKSAGS